MRPDDRTPDVDGTPAWASRRVRTVLLPFVLIAVMLLGACTATEDPVITEGTTDGTSLGSATDDAETAGTTPGSTASTSTTERSTTTTSKATTSTTSRTSSTTGPSTTGPVSPDAAAFCTRFKEIDDQMSSIGASTSDAEILTFLKQAFAELATLAPPAIAQDWNYFNDIVQSVTDPNQLNNLDSDPDFVAATDRLEAWVTANCGFSLTGN